jgi:hypothetical protein
MINVIGYLMMINNIDLLFIYNIIKIRWRYFIFLRYLRLKNNCLTINLVLHFLNHRILFIYHGLQL